MTNVERSVTFVVLKNISLSLILGFITQERERERERERGRERDYCHVAYMSNVHKYDIFFRVVYLYL